MCLGCTRTHRGRSVDQKISWPRCLRSFMFLFSSIRISNNLSASFSFTIACALSPRFRLRHYTYPYRHNTLASGQVADRGCNQIEDNISGDCHESKAVDPDKRLCLLNNQADCIVALINLGHTCILLGVSTAILTTTESLKMNRDMVRLA